MKLNLTAKTPLNLALLPQIMTASTPLNGNITQEHQQIHYAVAYNGQGIPVTVTFDAQHPNKVAVTADNDDSAFIAFIAFLAIQVRSFLSLDDDLAPFYALATKDPIFKPILDRMTNVHQVRFQTPFHAGLWGLISQRNSQKVARNQINQLMIDGAFPTPGDILAQGEEAIGEILKNDRKASYIMNLAESFAPDYLTELNLFPGQSDEQVYEQLRAIKGIGEWTGHFILMRGMGRTSLIPYEELANQKVIKKYYGDRDVARMVNYYGDYQSYWVNYLRYFDALFTV